MFFALLAVALAVALAAGILAVRRFAGRRTDVTYAAVAAESPLTVLDRVEAAARRIRGYNYERKQDEIVIFRKHEGPLGYLESPQQPLAEAPLDLLHVTAVRHEGQTDVEVRGRSEPRVINRVRRALARAR